MKLISRALLGAACFAGASAHAQFLSPLSAFTLSNGARNGSAEIISYTKDDNFTVLSTVGDSSTAAGSFGVQILSLNSSGVLSEKGFADYTSIFGNAASWNGASSVAADPLGRGFGAVALIPAASTTTAGKVAFFDYRGATANGSRSLVVLDVGFHPDSVKFSADGTKLFVANEGEFIATSGTNAPGSLSVINLSSITGIGNVSSLTGAHVSTFDFQAGNLGSGVSLAGIRNSNVAAVTNSGLQIAAVPDFNTLGGTGPGSDANFFRGIEPEFIAQSGNKLYVTLQDNNAVGVFNITTNKWDAIHKLGSITQTIDGSDQDGPAALINKTVKGLPMPDSISTYTVAGQTYFVTANEGDARTDDRDISRFGNSSMNTILDTATVYPNTATGVRAAGNLGRLNLSRLDGDNGANGGTAGDGKIDDITMIGTRSFSIWNADTGALVWDSGSGNGNAADASINPLTNLESLTLALDPTRFNMNNGLASNFDLRSDDKGPEPEGLTLGVIDGRTYAFVSLERQNGLMMFDITDPTSVTFSSYTNPVTSGLISPESLLFISGADSPTGGALVLGGFEGTNDTTSRGIAVLSAVPEPATGLWAASALLGLALRRRRQA